MKIRFHHTTTYQFDKPVPYGLQRIRMKPKDNGHQKVSYWSMVVRGGVCEANYDDAHRNHVSLIRVEEGTETVEIICAGEVETESSFHGVVGLHQGYAPLWLFRQPTALTKGGPAVTALANRVRPRAGEGEIALLHALSDAVADAVRYQLDATHVGTTAEEAAQLGQGVCQDHAHIFISAARLLGIPARYVSGYLFMEDRVEQEAGHAWAEAHIEGLGWVGFDVSNRICPDEHYIRVATGRDYADAAPIHAMTFGAGDSSLLVSLRVDQ
ncbi:MAG: transglutaminase family protein [Sphingobium sp.]|jgi:transglutaminase-like putative cysteine protease|nr:transglutaminase family protein [Sphingobium sp.]MCI1271993.1 transglutaminase family protein [Sphingobium sp.]MCI1755956.1 transglutaminase family protein [Sphingobium sp.]MCI2054109.1 transglutaminase family protein [Sphingobium sp.]